MDILDQIDLFLEEVSSGTAALQGQGGDTAGAGTTTKDVAKYTKKSSIINKKKKKKKPFAMKLEAVLKKVEVIDHADSEELADRKAGAKKKVKSGTQHMSSLGRKLGHDSVV